MSERELIQKILRESENPTIMDLGAYHGEDTAWMLAAANGVRAVMVEADPQNFATIQSRGLAATAIHAAIADHSGTCDFWACYTAEGRGSGSIREPTGHRVKDGITYDFRKMDNIPCYSLDDLFRSQGFDHIDVLWVDLQGTEKDMILGGQEALRRTRYLFIESEEKELYGGQALRPELLALLPGWSIVETFDFNLLLQNDN